MALSQLISSSNYLKDKEKIVLVQNAVLGNDIEKPNYISNDILNAVFKRRYKYEVNIKELLYTILYLEDCDINMLWENFDKFTPLAICFSNNDIFSIDYGKEIGMMGGENILRFTPVSSIFLNNKINMINDEELKQRIMVRFAPELVKVYKKIRKRDDK